jgi:predicted nucleic acid-binding protein
MRYLLDADWIIQVLAGRNEAVVAHKRINPEEIAVSYITIGEIYVAKVFGQGLSWTTLSGLKPVVSTRRRDDEHA